MHIFTVYDMFKRNAVLFADKSAVVENNISHSFGEMLNDVHAMASELAEMGIKTGDRAAILSMNRYEYLVFYGACAALQAVAVPLNWRLSEKEIAHILSDSGSSLLLFDDTHKTRAESLAASYGFTGKLLPLCIPVAAGEMSFDMPVKDNIFCLIYTAAVDGKPRGAALSHSNIIFSNLQTCMTMGIDNQEVYLNILPLFHITGLNLALCVMHAGGKNVIMEKFDASGALSLTQKENVTLMGSFPPILSRLMEEMDKASYDILSLKKITGIDGPDNIAPFARQTGAVFWMLYGQSETSGFVTLSDAMEIPGSAGRQCCISELSILDEHDRDVETDGSGEICVRGPGVFQGYWKEGGFDTSSFRNGWHHTGDMGRIDKDGYLWFQGRKPEKELIKPGGENVYPAEVEAVILEHPGIVSTCVIGVPDPKFGEGIKAVCVKKQGAESFNEKDLIEFVGLRIARYKKPGYVEFVESLPKTGSGAVDRSKVKDMYGVKG